MRLSLKELLAVLNIRLQELVPGRDVIPRNNAVNFCESQFREINRALDEVKKEVTLNLNLKETWFLDKEKSDVCGK